MRLELRLFLLLLLLDFEAVVVSVAVVSSANAAGADNGGFTGTFLGGNFVGVVVDIFLSNMLVVSVHAREYIDGLKLKSNETCTLEALPARRNNVYTCPNFGRSVFLSIKNEVNTRD